MEVRPGYKQTGVGVIPDEWDVKTIDQVAFVTSGKRLPLGSSLVDVPTPHPYVRVTDMRPGTVDISEIMYVPESVFPAIKRYRIYQSDIFISVAGSLGIVGKIPAELDGANLTENADRITDITCSQDYLLYVLLSPLIQNAIDSIRTVGAQPKLALTRIRKFAVPLPPTEIEQRAIATVLSDVDALLGGLDRLIAKKRDLKQAAMQQLLTGQTRLPGFHGEWETLPARDIGVIKGGSGFPLATQGETGGEYPFFKVSDMNNEGNETFMTTANHYISEQTRKRLGATAFPADSIVFAKVGAAVFLERKRILGQASCIDNNMAAFVLDKTRAGVGYVHSLLLSKKLGALVATTALPALNAKQLGEMPLAVPPLSEQTAIAAALSDMDAELAALEARRNKTRDLKQGMMQELLTGKTRFVHAGAAHA